MDSSSSETKTSDETKMEGKKAEAEQRSSFSETENAVKIDDKKEMEETSGRGDKETFSVDKPFVDQNKEEKEPPIELNSKLVTLISTAKFGDVRTLQKMTTAVKIFLAESHLQLEKQRQSVCLLLDREDFVTLLMKCLKTDVTRTPQLVADGLWILNVILKTNESKICKMLDSFVNAGLIQLMTKLISVQNNGVHELATESLGSFVFWGYRDQLKAQAIPIFSAMAILLKKRNRSVCIQKTCVHIISCMLGHVIHIDFSKDNLKEHTAAKESEESKNKNGLWRSKEFVDKLPPISWVKEIIPLLNILMNAEDDEVLGDALSCLTYTGCVEGSLQYIIDCGIMKKAAPKINHSDKVVRYFAITAISSIASINEAVAFKFLKSMKGTFGLKYYFKALNTNNKPINRAAGQFFTTVVSAVTRERPVSDLNSILTSGIIETFVQCLNAGMQDKYVMGSIWALGRICTHVPIPQRRWIVDAGALPLLVDQLKNGDTLISSTAALVIGNLVADTPLNRDQILDMGAISLMINLINRDDISISDLINVLAALELISAVKPRTKPEVLKDLPQVLIAVLDNKANKCPDEVTAGIFSIIGKVCESGSAGIDLVLESGFLKRMVFALKNEYNLGFALDVLECISRGTKIQTDKLTEEAGMVEVLLELLEHPIKNIRKLASRTLCNLNNTKMIIHKKIAEMLHEILKEEPREIHPAGLAFQNVMLNFSWHGIV